MQKDTSQLRSDFQALCSKLGVKRVFRTTSPQDGTPHIEIADGTYYYVVAERGTEFERRATNSSDELLSWLMSDVSFDIACDFELAHRVPGQDARRLLFARQLELLELVSSAWAKKRGNEMDLILQSHPFADGNPS